jgi:4-hydroxy-tetrahydrodipicolinate synthase
MPLTGVWLPIVTPFLDGKVDYKSYERLLEYYLDKGLSGIIPLGTTGESVTLEDDEVDALVDLTTRVVGDRMPVYVGVGGNSTAKVVKTLQRLERYPFEGILSVCPYYNRPSEEGMRRHFEEIAASTTRNVVLYNIPYRTGVNLSNDSVLDLSRIANIVGIKDSCANLAQSNDLLRRKPARFSVLTGEDAQFFTTLALGGQGGILASSHFEPRRFVEVYRRVAANDHQGARRIWATLEPAVQLLFREPNPMPLKHWLWRQGLIASPECRLPLTRVSESLAQALDAFGEEEASRVVA